MKKIILIILCLSLFSCFSKLDKRLLEISSETRQVNLLFVEACKSFADAADKVVKMKFSIQEILIRDEWDKFYDKYKESCDTMIEKDMKQQYDKTLQNLTQLEKSKKSWEEHKNIFLYAIEQLQQATISTEATEGEIVRAKAAVKSYFNSALSVLGAAAVVVLAP